MRDDELHNMLTYIVDTTQNKVEVVENSIQLFEANSFSVVEVNIEKPWGAYIRLNNRDAERYMDTFFPELEHEIVGELSPKILIVEPGKRLSWQYHHRRAESWLFVTGGYYYQSDTDELGDKKSATAGDSVQFQQGERHRLVGGDTQMTVVAEIWQHTDPNALSDEDDIVRVQDDFNR